MFKKLNKYIRIVKALMTSAKKLSTLGIAHVKRVLEDDLLSTAASRAIFYLHPGYTLIFSQNKNHKGDVTSTFFS